FPTLRGQEILVIRLGHMGDDVESLGPVLERLWCKVEVDGGGFVAKRRPCAFNFDQEKVQAGG
ncbi:hypothetical protein Tco_0377024, partial [Tanacetum coccineum]